MRFLLKAYIAFVISSGAWAQGSTDDPNLLMGEAIELYEDGMAASGDKRKTLLIEVDAILQRIRTEFPDSIPADFMRNGDRLGIISQMTLTAELANPTADLPETLAESIRATARTVCDVTECEDAIISGLSSFFLETVYADWHRAIDVEKVKWLFSNPGQIDSNLERVNLYSELVEDTGVLTDLDRRIGESLFEELAKEAAKDIGISLLTNLVSEVTARELEQGGYEREAEMVRTWAEPTVDIARTLIGAGGATVGSAGTAATVIWAKNAYSLVELGQKDIEAEAAGATKEAQLANLASDIYSLQKSLITGKTTGPLFEGDEGITVTPRMAEVFQSTLQSSYELQSFWLSSDEAVLMDVFAPIFKVAREAARIVDALSDEDELGQRTPALPSEFAGPEIAPEGFLGPDVSSPMSTLTARATPSWRTGGDRGGLIPGETFLDAELRSDNSVWAFGRQGLLPLNAGERSSAYVQSSPDGAYRVITQDVPGPGGSWTPRLALVPRDTSRPVISMSPDDVFRFGGRVAWSADGRFAVVEYNFGEFESYALLVDLLTGGRGVIQSDRQTTQISSALVDSTRYIGNGTHAIDFSHLVCPADDPNCGMATIEYGGTSVVTFRLPDTAGSSVTAAGQRPIAELVASSTVPQEATSSREWTAAIVHEGGYGREDLTRCLFDTDSSKSTAECLLDDGATDETIRFARARATEGGEGPEVPVRFKELGKVDIVFLDSFSMNQNEWEYFVNTSPETITYPMYPEEELSVLASQGDRRAQSILTQFPGATAWKPFVGGMRILPNGHQRFSTVVYWTESCRACPIIGYNVATVDYDQAGTFRAFEARGVFDNRRYRKLMNMNADDLRQNNAAIQYYLNLRGYDAGPMDGAIGPKTRTALAEFQRENGINAGTGQPDTQTLTALTNPNTMFNNGYEGDFSSAQQASIGTSPLPGCANPGEPLSTADMIAAFSGATITYENGRKTRFEAFPAENTWVRQFAVNESGEAPYREPVRVTSGKLCQKLREGEFCEAVNRCESGEALFVLTPYSGTSSYVISIERPNRAAVPSPVKPVTLNRTMTLGWSGVPQGVVGTLEITGSLDESGLRLSVLGLNGRHNPGSRVNAVDRGAEIDFFIQATPRKNCDGCKPLDGSFRSATTIRLRNDVLTGPYGETTAFVPMAVLQRNDLVSVSLVGTNNTIYLSDLTLDLARDLGIGGAASEAAAAEGPFTAPPGTSWLQLASRETLAEAREFAPGTGDGARIFRASNGWYAITGTLLSAPEYEALPGIVRANGWPADSLLTRGANFVEEMSLDAGTPPPPPAFIRTETLRSTELLSRYWRDSSPIYDTIEMLPAGREVLVWALPDSEGDCLVDNHEGIFIKCRDIAGFDAATDQTMVADTSMRIGNPADRFEEIGGEATVQRLIAATRWENSEQERALLNELAVVSGEDFRRLGDLEKLSRLMGILHLVESRAGVPDGTFEVLNFARNRMMARHPSRDEARRDAAWRESDRKSFHVIGIAEPDRVEKYTRADGGEAVFYNNPQTGWSILDDGVNNATFNFVPDVGLLDEDRVNDNYQHLVLDIVPWVIWGATPRDTTSIPERIALFENDPSYRLVFQRLLTLASLRPFDGDPVTTNDISPRLDLRTASAAELVALLRGFGVTEENVSFASGDIAVQETEAARLITSYRNDPPLVVTPHLPLSGGYDAERQTFSICVPRSVFFPGDLVKGGSQSFGGNSLAGLMIVPSDPINGLGALPAICVVQMGEINKVEALHGTGELARFGLERPSGLFLRLGMSAQDGKVFEEAVASGQARIEVQCEMRTMVRKPFTAMPYDYERFGTCIPRSVKLAAIDFESGDTRWMEFSAGRQVFTATSRLVTSLAPEPEPDPTAATMSVERASWSFKTDETGEQAVRNIVAGLEGTPVEILLGYQNAFPFQTAPAKKLAVAIFNALPESDVATQAGTERGYGSFVLKSWSDLNHYYFVDDPEPGLASAIAGNIDAIRILSIRELAASSCEWSVTYRVWLRDRTPFGEALDSISSSDGHTFESCFRTTRDGYDITSYRYIDG